MMLWYKAWRESRVRFGIMAIAIAWACGVVILMHQVFRSAADEPITYINFVWKAVYKGAVRDMYILLAMMLGLGGLMQERANGTSGYTLALPVSRRRLIATRAAVGVLELTVLAFLPAMMLSALSPFRGEAYPFAQGLRFAILWACGGAIVFSMTLFFSTILEGEYTAWALCVAALSIYLAGVHLPPLARYAKLDFLEIMNASGLTSFRSADSILKGPLPWLSLFLMLFAAVVFVSLAAGVTNKCDFS